MHYLGLGKQTEGQKRLRKMINEKESSMIIVEVQAARLRERETVEREGDERERETTKTLARDSGQLVN